MTAHGYSIDKCKVKGMSNSLAKTLGGTGLHIASLYASPMVRVRTAYVCKGGGRQSSCRCKKVGTVTRALG